jgi:hypothetical protein
MNKAIDMQASQMGDFEKIEQVIVESFNAAKHSDLTALSGFYTQKMQDSLKQTRSLFRFGLFFAKLFYPRAIKNSTIENITIESQDETMAVASYVVTAGWRRQYERVVLKYEYGAWKIDGKFG